MIKAQVVAIMVSVLFSMMPEYAMPLANKPVGELIFSGFLSFNAQVTLLEIACVLFVFALEGVIRSHSNDVFADLNRERDGQRSIHAQAVGFGVVHRSTSRDISVASIHEAGHALLYAALPQLPDGFVIKVLDGPDNGALGYVGGGIFDVNLITDSSYIEWSMLVLLSGRAAELSAFGNATIGAGNDYSKWRLYAHSYLSAGFGKWLRFFKEPSTFEEKDANSVVLESLLQEQLKWLQVFFTLNKSVLMELSNAIREKRTLTAEDAQPYLASVLLPDDCPRPNLDDTLALVGADQS